MEKVNGHGTMVKFMKVTFIKGIKRVMVFKNGLTVSHMRGHGYNVNNMGKGNILTKMDLGKWENGSMVNAYIGLMKNIDTSIY